MNNNQFAVMQPERGLPSVVNTHSNTFWELKMMGYTVLQEGTKRVCYQYVEEFMAELLATEE